MERALAKEIDVLLGQVLMEYRHRLGKVVEILSQQMFQVRLSTKNGGTVFDNYEKAIEFARQDSIDNPKVIVSIDRIQPSFFPDSAKFKNGEQIV